MGNTQETRLSKWYDGKKEGDLYPTYTHDYWTIPEGGTEIWCTGWKRGQVIKPCGDRQHICVGPSIYHVDEFMGILRRWESEGASWGIVGVHMKREQQNAGRWEKVNLEEAKGGENGSAL